MDDMVGLFAALAAGDQDNLWLEEAIDLDYALALRLQDEEAAGEELRALQEQEDERLARQLHLFGSGEQNENGAHDKEAHRVQEEEDQRLARQIDLCGSGVEDGMDADLAFAMTLQAEEEREEEARAQGRRNNQQSTVQSDLAMAMALKFQEEENAKTNNGFDRDRAMAEALAAAEEAEKKQRRPPVALQPLGGLTQSLEGALGSSDELLVIRDADVSQLRRFLVAYPNSVVRPVRNAALANAFAIARRELQDRLGENHDGAQPQVCFHGTRVRHLESIISGGLKVPGGENNLEHANDEGWYGKGIYVSHDPDYAFDYAESGRLIVCCVLLGRSYDCAERKDGRACEPGFDSHTAEEGDEYVLFHSCRVLPLWVIDTQPKG